MAGRLDGKHAGSFRVARGREQHAVDVEFLVRGEDLGVVGLHAERAAEPHAAGREDQRVTCGDRASQSLTI